MVVESVEVVEIFGLIEVIDGFEVFTDANNSLAFECNATLTVVLAVDYPAFRACVFRV